MGKKNRKNNKNNYWDQEDVGETVPSSNASATPAEESSNEEGKEPQVASAADDFANDDFMSNLKKAKHKQVEKERKEEEEKKRRAQMKKGPVLKSKKERERERKERDKKRRKEASAKRREARERKQKEAAEKAAKEGKDDTKQKKESEEKNAYETGAVKVPVKKTVKKKKKGKKVPAALALLKKQMALRKAAEEAAKAEEEAEKKRIEDEEKRLADEEKAREEAKKQKKEREKAKIAQLKKEGKYLTKKQRKERAAATRRREFLMQSSTLSVAGMENKGQSESVNKKKYREEKERKEKERKERKERELKEKQEKEAAEKAKKEKEEAEKAEEAKKEDVLVDDWEKLAAGDDEGLAEDWEELEGESEETPETPAKKVGAKEEQQPEVSKKEAPKKEKVIKKQPANAAAVASPKEAKKLSKAENEKKELRSPICCILGHVDAGKTKLLDKIRQTNVQGGEAGGITQQIGATYFPVEALQQKTRVMSKFEKLNYEVPGLLVIDTPGHESFTNLRSRGSSLCNIAILVVDITHGLQQQTLESLRLLRDRKAPFVVALNKVDRLYGWQTIPNNSFRDSFTRQTASVQTEFNNKLEEIKLQLAEQGLNSELYFKNPNMARYVSIVPTSAVTGEGVPDLLWLLLELTQKRMSKQLLYLSGVQATILEVNVTEGFGTTIDVILSNGVLHENDRIVLCGLAGPIATNIRALLTPPPSREMRVKSEYVHHHEVKAALGVKIAANDLEKAVAGSRLLVVHEGDDEAAMKDEVMDDLTGLLDSVDPTGRGVVVQASTLGSLEALLEFLKQMKIPVMAIGLGPVYRKDVMKAVTMLDKAPEYAIMLCFDVKIDHDAQQYADEQNIKIFNSNVIYHLFDAFTAYQEQLIEKKRQENKDKAVFPCVLKTIQIINKRNPMIIGVDVLEGIVKIGTPIGTVKIDAATGKKEKLLLGRVSSMEINHEPKEFVRKGDTSAGVAIRLESSASQPIWGRHVDEKDPLYSMITRETIDVLKDPAFRSTVPREDWFLIKKLKSVLEIE